MSDVVFNPSVLQIRTIIARKMSVQGVQMNSSTVNIGMEGRQTFQAKLRLMEKINPNEHSTTNVVKVLKKKGRSKKKMKKTKTRKCLPITLMTIQLYGS